MVHNFRGTFLIDGSKVFDDKKNNYSQLKLNYRSNTIYLLLFKTNQSIHNITDRTMHNNIIIGVFNNKLLQIICYFHTPYRHHIHII